jgi:hypothetical protein
MMMTRTTCPALIALLMVAGCQSKLNVDHTVQMESATLKSIEIDPPRYDQKMAVTIQSDNPVTVYIYLQKDKAAVTDAIDKGKKPEAVLTMKENVQNESLDVTVPAKQGAVVTLQTTSKPASVKLKLLGK